MSEDLINQITLNCLMNKKQYEKYVASQVSKSVHDEEKKFYRKRIYCLTKDLLLAKEEPMNLLPDVKYAFDNYIKSCIHYFKVLDSHDILQEEYKQIQEYENINRNNANNNNNTNDDTNNNTKDDTNDDGNGKTDLLDKMLDSSRKSMDETLTTRVIKPFYSSLDPFVTVTSTKPAEEMILPKQREVNLQDPTLINKGIFEKKKNLTNV
jgi:hypothetical protein